MDENRWPKRVAIARDRRVTPAALATGLHPRGLPRPRRADRPGGADAARLLHGALLHGDFPCAVDVRL